MEEEWRKIRFDIYHHDGVCDYSISNQGQVCNDKTGRILKPRQEPSGRLSVQIRHKGKYYTFQVAHLVAQEFITKNLRVVRVHHKDGDVSNCRSDNLDVISYRKYNPHAPGEPYPPRYVDRKEE